MAIYEYHCKKCSEKFEKLIRGEQEIVCPKCKSKEVDKLFSVFSPSIKGSSSGSVPSCPSGSCCSGGICGFKLAKKIGSR